MKIISSSTSPEHWLTLMTCAICNKTPKASPVYKCELGHTICYSCFTELITRNGIPICLACDSDKFIRCDVREDFLHKLQTKPGIGRPNRYAVNKNKSDSAHSKNAGGKEAVTVEQLFQLSSTKLQQLFSEKTKEKLRFLNSYDLGKHVNICTSSFSQEVNHWEYCSSKGSFNTNNANHFGPKPSRKPLKCPHDPCNKIVAVSSFQTHFKYEHCDFKRYQVERGKELLLAINPVVIQHDKSICLGIIKLSEPPDPRAESSSICNIAQKFQEIKKTEFWIMASGSVDDRPKYAFALFWLFCNEDNFNCTLEVASNRDFMAVTTLCGVNNIQQSQNLNQVMERLNCLIVTYGCLKSMLSYGRLLKFRITIH